MAAAQAIELCGNIPKYALSEFQRKAIEDMFNGIFSSHERRITYIARQQGATCRDAVTLALAALLVVKPESNIKVVTSACELAELMCVHTCAWFDLLRAPETNYSKTRVGLNTDASHGIRFTYPSDPISMFHEPAPVVILYGAEDQSMGTVSRLFHEVGEDGHVVVVAWPDSQCDMAVMTQSLVEFKKQQKLAEVAN